MKKLSEHLKQALSALAAADAGEMLTRRQMDRVLHRPEEPVSISRRKVALWAAGVPGKDTLDYALAACKRLDASLVFLHGEDTDTSWLHERLRNLAVETVALHGRPEESLREHIATHSQVAFLVLDGSDLGSQNLVLRTGDLGVPVVLVATPRDAKPMPQAVPKAAPSGKAPSPIPHQATPLSALG